MDDHGIKPSADDIQKQLDQQESDMGEVLPEDQEIEDIDDLHKKATGIDEDIPADQPLGTHIHKQDNQEDDTPRPEEN